MPATVTSASGTVYHLFQLPDCIRSPQLTDKTMFTVLRNDLGDAYRSSRLFGSNTGVKEWKLQLPTLASGDISVPTATDPNGAAVSREQYIRSLYAENMVTGEPFVFTDPSNGQYYLVDFVDESLDMQRVQMVLYSTGLTLRQRRIIGETVFQVPNMVTYPVSQPYIYFKEAQSTNFGGAAHVLLDSFGDVLTPTYNGLDTWRLNSVSNTGYLQFGEFGDEGDPTEVFPMYDIFLVMKCREATFGQTSGVLTGAASVQYLIGENGQSRFQDLSLTNYEYRLNGIVDAAQPAPMQRWGIVHQRFSTARNGVKLQLGKDRAVAGTHAEIDVAEFIGFTSSLPMYLVRELTEYLNVKWAISTQ